MKHYNKHINMYKYMTYLSEDDDPDYYSKRIIYGLYKYLENYLTISVNQLDRIHSEAENISNISKNNPKYTNLNFDITIYNGDLHFFLISFEKCYSLAMQLYANLGFDKKQLLLKHSEKYICIKQIRNCLEHLDENLADDSTMRQEFLASTDLFSKDSNWFEYSWGSNFLNKIEFRKKNNKVYILELMPNTLNEIITHYGEITSIINEKYVAPYKDIVDKIFKNHLPKR